MRRAHSARYFFGGRSYAQHEREGLPANENCSKSANHDASIATHNEIMDLRPYF